MTMSGSTTNRMMNKRLAMHHETHGDRRKTIPGFPIIRHPDSCQFPLRHRYPKQLIGLITAHFGRLQHDLVPIKSQHPEMELQLLGIEWNFS